MKRATHFGERHARRALLEEGDRKARDLLVQRHHGSVTRFFHNKVSDEEDAAERVSQTFFSKEAAVVLRLEEPEIEPELIVYMLPCFE